MAHGEGQGSKVDQGQDKTYRQANTNLFTLKIRSTQVTIRIKKTPLHFKASKFKGMARA